MKNLISVTALFMAASFSLYAQNSSETHADIPPNSPINGDFEIKLKGQLKNYTLRRVDQEESARVFSLISAKQPITWKNSYRGNYKFKNAELIVTPGEGMYGDIVTLKNNNEIIFSTTIDSDGFIANYTTALENEDELLLVGTWQGGNSCENSRQLLVADSGDNKYNISLQFGRCNPLIYEDKGKTYLVYSPDEYNPMIIYSLTSTPISTESDSRASVPSNSEAYNDKFPNTIEYINHMNIDSIAACMAGLGGVSQELPDKQEYFSAMLSIQWALIKEFKGDAGVELVTGKIDSSFSEMERVGITQYLTDNQCSKFNADVSKYVSIMFGIK